MANVFDIQWKMRDMFDKLDHERKGEESDISALRGMLIVKANAYDTSILLSFIPIIYYIQHFNFRIFQSQLGCDDTAECEMGANDLPNNGAENEAGLNAAHSGGISARGAREARSGGREPPGNEPGARRAPGSHVKAHVTRSQ
jgi:hypothetical protein